MLNFSITFWELCMELLDLQGMLLLPGAHRRAGIWHCLAPLGLIRAAWALFCCWMCLGLFFLGELPTEGKGE